jgi:hypothetical protein
MNIYTRWIAELLKLDLESALAIQDQMQIDFSECTRQQFNKEARLTHSIMQELAHQP